MSGIFPSESGQLLVYLFGKTISLMHTLITLVFYKSAQHYKWSRRKEM